jgi:hypothetical protein
MGRLRRSSVLASADRYLAAAEALFTNVGIPPANEKNHDKGGMINA